MKFESLRCFGGLLLNGGHVTPQVNLTGKQALFVTVTDREMRLARLEFVYKDVESLGPDWVVPLGTTERPFAFAARRAARKAPAFPTDAKVHVERTSPPPAGKKGPPALARVTFDQALPVDGCRVFDYEVTPVVMEDDIELPLRAKRVLAPGFNRPPARATGEKGLCCFALSDLPPKAHVRFEVRAVECFGRKSEPITSSVELY